MLGQVKEKARLTPIAFSSAPTDQASTWRAWYTFFKQQNGDFLKDGQLSFADMPKQGKTSLQTLVDMAEGGLITKNTAYPAMVALFSSGRSAFMINGNWEVPTVVDLKKSGKLPFDYGIVAFPEAVRQSLTPGVIRISLPFQTMPKLRPLPKKSRRL